MEQLYHQTNRVVKEIEEIFQRLSSAHSEEVNHFENEIQMKMTTVSSNCDRLDVLLYKVPVTQRPSSKMRVDQLKYDLRHLQNAFEMYKQKKQRKQAELSEREQLLNYRFTANATSPETCVDIDYSLQHHSSLQNAHHGVDEMINSGTSILSSLVNQRETLNAAKSKLKTIGNTLGLSNHTMKLIERRFAEDKYILFGGMILTMVVISIVVYFIVF